MKVIEAIRKGFGMPGKSFALLGVLFVFNLIWNLASLPFLGKAQAATGVRPTPGALIVGGVFILLNIFIQGGLFGVIKDAIISEGKVVLGNFAKYGKKFYLRLLGLGVFIFLAIALAVLIIGFIFSISVVVKNIIVDIIVVALAIILSAIALYYLFLLFVSPYALVIDDVGVLKAMGNSLRFVKKNLMKVVGLVILLVLIGLGLGFVVGMLTGPLSIVLKGTAFQVVTGVITSTLNTYLTVIITAAIMIYYHGLSGTGTKEETGQLPA